MNIHQTKQLLYSSGCTLPVDTVGEDIISCYSFVEKLSQIAEHSINTLRKNLYNLDKVAFTKEIIQVKQILSQCYTPMLLADCDYLLDLMDKEKYAICEAILERFCSNLTSFCVTYQTNKYRLTHQNTASPKEEQINLKNIENAENPAIIKTSKEASNEASNVALPKDYSENSNETFNTKPMILAVDDSPEILRTLQNILGKKYKLVALNSGVAALKFLKSNQPDIFILDIEMPYMNGFQLARKADIKNTEKPLIFLTGNSNQENLITALNMGATDFMVKPCDEKLILEKIAKLIKA